MKKSNKILLYLFSLLPFIWTFLLLLASYLYFKPNVLSELFILSTIVYFFFVTPTYSALITFLRVKNKISQSELILHLSLVFIGILGGYLSIKFDVFHVSSCYID